MVAPFASDQEMADLREVLAQIGAGHFSTEEIHFKHRSLASAKGRAPMHPTRLGQVLSDYGAIRKPKWDGSKRRQSGANRGKKGLMVKGWIV